MSVCSKHQDTSTAQEIRGPNEFYDGEVVHLSGDGVQMHSRTDWEGGKWQFTYNARKGLWLDQFGGWANLSASGMTTKREVELLRRATKESSAIVVSS
jgi:hypothetical protein